ncbi:hypothetical protein [Streptomyces sp. NPDC047108]|uniref:SCO7613 C-terminal domain-containing membrane protein n=1 Tax=Streptomyces sp. NPDC047108 TaxID=3155025 RepID=UPI0033D64138
MNNVPPALPPAAELHQLELTLARVESHRAWLLTRRAQLLDQLRQYGPGAAPPPSWGPPPGPWSAPRSPGAGPTSRRETRPPTVQNVLLALGGVLLAVAVTAFTVVSWGHMGIGGRAAVLGALTLGAMGTPALLLRRALRSTAEAVAGIGLVLLLLDAYALHQVALADTDPAGYAALATAAVAAIWGGYGLWLRRPPFAGAGDGSGPDTLAGTRGLLLPLPVAVVMAQLPLFLTAVAAGAGPLGFASALLATATADLALVLPLRERAARRAVRLTASVSASVTGVLGAVIAAGVSVTTTDPLRTAQAAGLLLVAAALGVTAAWPRTGRPSTDDVDAPVTAPEDRTPAGATTGGWATDPLVSALGAVARAWPAAAGGLALVTAVGGLLRTALPASWSVLGYVLCGAGVLAATRFLAARTAVASGLSAAAGLVYAGAALWTLPSVAVAVLAPVTWSGAVWSGAPSGARDALASDATSGVALGWPGTGAVPAVLAVVAITAMALHRRAPAGRTAAVVAAVVTWCAVGAVLPVALDLPHPVAVALLVAQAGVLLVASVTLASAHHVAADADVTDAAAFREGSASPSAADEPVASGPRPASSPPDPSHGAGKDAASLAALLCAVVMTLMAAFWSLAEQSVTLGTLGGLLVVHAAASAAGRSVRQRVTAAVATACTVALTVAVCAAVDLPPRRTAFAVLAVAASAAFVAARLRALPAGLAVECTGYAALLLATGLAARDLPTLASVLALAGVVVSGTALRPDRRAAGHAAAALFVLASWARLAGWDVAAPEAYTMPVSAAALFVGVRRHRQDPSVSSWAAYGPGLGATLLPSLMAAWDDTHWMRPLLLGLGALAVTLHGAHRRLRAPLLLGGTVLALVALHELAPYIVQVVDALPRWLPPALAGLLLLGTGATYEHRLRDARKIRDALGRMR